MRMEHCRRLSAANEQCHVCRVVDEVVWVKMTVHQRLAKSHGYYLQHAKEVRASGRHGNTPHMPTDAGGAVDHRGLKSICGSSYGS